MVREGEELWPGEEGDEFLDYYSRYRPLANRYHILLYNQNAMLQGHRAPTPSPLLYV
jgi:hypothetical protein